MRILIYQDYIHNNGVLYRALCRHFGTDNVGFCDADEIIGGDLDSSVTLFVMPGGADLYYAEKLNGKGNKAIRHYVENGGVYLGICAGAYYGCAALEWAKGSYAEISGPRELAFFSGKAVGPLHELIENHDVSQSHDAAPELIWDEEHESHVLYRGGPVFVPSRLADNFTVLAHYKLPGNPAAIIECKVGAGKAVLCSPHLEFTSADLKRTLYAHKNSSHGWQETVINRLHDSGTSIQQLWMLLMQRCVEKAGA